MVGNIFLSKTIDKSDSLGINAGVNLSRGERSDFKFDEMVVEMFDKLEKTTASAKDVVESYAINPESVSLEKMALLMSKAETEIRVATQVRNRMVAAYQDIMNMQV